MVHSTMISAIVLTLFLQGSLGRPIFNGAHNGQPMDHFLASGHDSISRLCQGPLGCGNIKTGYTTSYNPDEVDSKDFFGTAALSETDHTQEKPAEVGAVTESPAYEIEPDYCDETDDDYITFKSNTSLNGLKRAIDLLCPDEKCDAIGEIETEETGKKDVLTGLLFTISLIVAVFMLSMIGAMLILRKRRLSSMSEERERNVEEGDIELDEIDLGSINEEFDSRLSPIEEEEEEDIDEEGNPPAGEIPSMQVTEL